MLKTHILTLGLYQTNCYIIHHEQSKTCCVIDPGYESDTILSKCHQLGLSIEAILLTHGHFDHVGAVKELAAETDCKVFLNTADLTMPPMMTAGQLYHTDSYTEGTQLNLAGLSIGVLHTPGHTPGSVCLVCEQSIFSGDTLFAQGCGRTDLPGGDWDTILSSLKRLSSIEGNFWVYPGHGPATTLSQEKRHNPYMR